jgi:hypothetical protein
VYVLALCLCSAEPPGVATSDPKHEEDRRDDDIDHHRRGVDDDIDHHRRGVDDDPARRVELGEWR